MSLKSLVKGVWHQSFLEEHHSIIWDLLWQMAQGMHLKCSSRVPYQQVIICVQQRCLPCTCAGKMEAVAESRSVISSSRTHKAGELPNEAKFIDTLIYSQI